MTDKKTEALKLALKYLRDNQHYIADNERHAYVMEYNAFVERLEALAEQPADPFGIGGCLVAIKNLLSRDPCAHAKVAIAMIDAMLAEQPAQQEPVAYKITGKLGVICSFHGGVNVKKGDFVYTSPPASKPWVGLTTEDRYKAIRPLYCDDATAALAACHSNDEYEAIEAKLRSKNGY